MQAVIPGQHLLLCVFFRSPAVDGSVGIGRRHPVFPLCGMIRPLLCHGFRYARECLAADGSTFLRCFGVAERFIKPQGLALLLACFLINPFLPFQFRLLRHLRDQSRKAFQPQACAFGEVVPKHPWVDDLGRLSRKSVPFCQVRKMFPYVIPTYNPNRVFNSDSVAVSCKELCEKLDTLSLATIFSFLGEMHGTTYGQVGAGWKSQNHVPSVGNVVVCTVRGLNLALSVKDRENISLYVPLRMSAGAWDNITRIGFMS